jgi:heme/copper-type cytochrome/quinol oxidase subunit 2
LFDFYNLLLLSVLCFTVVFMVRSLRLRRGGKRHRGRTRVELLWGRAPLIVLAALAYPSFKALFRREEGKRGEAVTVSGAQ